MTTRRGRLGLLSTAAFIVAAVALGGRIYGQHLAHQDMLERDRAMRQLELQSQRLERQRTERNSEVASLQVQLADAQNRLNAIVPVKNTYNVTPNQAFVVADGHLTLGLVGLPTSDGVTINVNGKQYAAAAGDVIRVANDASKPCTVIVQSFDMFSAMLMASCIDSRTR